MTFPNKRSFVGERGKGRGGPERGEERTYNGLFSVLVRKRVGNIITPQRKVQLLLSEHQSRVQTGEETTIEVLPQLLKLFNGIAMHTPE